MRLKIAIIGSGIVGSLVAWYLCQHNCEVHLFTVEDKCNPKSCSNIAAGMLSPSAEAALLSPYWYQLALQSLTLWPKIINSLYLPVELRTTGTLLIAPITQKSLLDHFLLQLKCQTNLVITKMMTPALENLVPDLTKGYVGCYLPQEGSVNPQQLLPALENYLLQQGVQWHHSEMRRAQDFAKVFDCRGLGAKQNLPSLRGVRGETIVCHAPMVDIDITIRLLHNRFPCYIVPRANKEFVIGATQIESESNAPITVQSALELLMSATHIHVGFKEAVILQLNAGCRPTLPNHQPMVTQRGNIIAINGMFRHGFLLAPALVNQVIGRMFE